MNKIMEKLFSLPKAKLILILVVGVLVAGVVGFASAALVNFLSNYVGTITTVTSPVEMKINLGRDGAWETGTNSINITTTGGSHFTFTTVAKNNANNPIDGYPVIVVVAPEGKNFTGGELTKVMLETEGAPPLNITDFLYIVGGDGTLHLLSAWTGNSKRLVLFYDWNRDGIAVRSPILAGATRWTVLTVTPHQAIAPGVYGIYAQFVDDLASYATHQYSL
jgi:hypothetical protein